MREAVKRVSCAAMLIMCIMLTSLYLHGFPMWKCLHSPSLSLTEQMSHVLLNEHDCDELECWTVMTYSQDGNGPVCVFVCSDCVCSNLNVWSVNAHI